MDLNKRSSKFNKKPNNNNIVYNLNNLKNKKLDNDILKFFNNFNQNIEEDEIGNFSSEKTNSNNDEKSDKFYSLNKYSNISILISFIKLNDSSVQIKIEFNKNKNIIIVEGKNYEEIIKKIDTNLENDYKERFERNLLLLVIIKKLNFLHFTDKNKIYTKLINDIINF